MGFVKNHITFGDKKSTWTHIGGRRGVLDLEQCHLHLVLCFFQTKAFIREIASVM